MTDPANRDWPKSCTGCVCVSAEHSPKRPVVCASVSRSARWKSSRLERRGEGREERREEEEWRSG